MKASPALASLAIPIPDAWVGFLNARLPIGVSGSRKTDTSLRGVSAELSEKEGCAR